MRFQNAGINHALPDCLKRSESQRDHCCRPALPRLVILYPLKGPLESLEGSHSTPSRRSKSKSVGCSFPLPLGMMLTKPIPGVFQAESARANIVNSAELMAPSFTTPWSSWNLFSGWLNRLYQHETVPAAPFTSIPQVNSRFNRSAHLRQNRLIDLKVSPNSAFMNSAV